MMTNRAVEIVRMRVFPAQPAGAVGETDFFSPGTTDRPPDFGQILQSAGRIGVEFEVCFHRCLFHLRSTDTGAAPLSSGRLCLRIRIDQILDLPQPSGTAPGFERNRHLSNRRAIFTNHSSGRTARRRDLAISTSKTPRSHSDRPYRNPLFPPPAQNRNFKFFF